MSTFNFCLGGLLAWNIASRTAHGAKALLNTFCTTDIKMLDKVVMFIGRSGADNNKSNETKKEKQVMWVFHVQRTFW